MVLPKLQPNNNNNNNNNINNSSMKTKNQPPISSEADAKEKLIVFVYEYLTQAGAKRAAQAFLDDIQYGKTIQIDQIEGPGFLVNWWCVFWDLYCAAPERRNQAEPSNEARTFHEYNSRAVMSPSCPPQTSPQQQHKHQPMGPSFMPAGSGVPQMMGAARYGHHTGQSRAGPLTPVGQTRMQTMGGQAGPPPPPQMGVGGGGQAHPGAPMMGGAGSPRYGPHPGHMTLGSSGPMEPSGTMNHHRMTPNHNGSPHSQAPGGGMQPMPGSSGPPGGSLQQRAGPPQAWQQANFSVNSPADQQQCFMPGPPPVSTPQQGDAFGGGGGGGGSMMSDGSMMDVKSASGNNIPQNQQQQDEYVMPSAYGEQPSDQGEANSEILKLKESLENATKDYNDSDQAGFNMDYSEPPGKW